MIAADLSRTITAPSGVQLTIIDALRNASGYLHDSDGDAYTSAASALLDAVLADIDSQPNAVARLCIDLHADGHIFVSRHGDLNKIADYLAVALKGEQA